MTDQDTEELHYFDPYASRNSQKSTTDIREDTTMDANLLGLPYLNETAADLIAFLYDQSEVVLGTCYEPDDGHLGLYFRTTGYDSLTLGVLHRWGFFVSAATERTLPYQVDGETVREAHAYIEVYEMDAPVAEAARAHHADTAERLRGYRFTETHNNPFTDPDSSPDE